MSDSPSEQHGRDTGVPITHVEGVGNVWRCRCGRDVLAGTQCDGTQTKGRTIPKIGQPDPRGAETLMRLGKHLQQNGSVVLNWTNGAFFVGSEWGQEADDSPMAGAAAYGADPYLVDALEQMLKDSLR